jgi:cytochrome c oxidase assembly protein subunit 15
MVGAIRPVRRFGYQPALAWFAAVGAAWVLVLVMLGAFTTSIGAGMVFPDWPLSNGSLDPSGWLTDVAMFAEHAHRLSAGVMSVITIILAGWLWRGESRRWLRRLGYLAVGLVLAQAVVGGLRVLLDGHQVAMVDTSVGRLFAMLHACLAQIFACTLLAIAAALSRPWIERRPGDPPGAGEGVRRLGIVCCSLLLVQLGVAAVMRHSFAGLAIPTFPLTPDGGLLPAHWDFRVGVAFAHRALALVLAFAIGGLAAAVWRPGNRTHPGGFAWRWLAALLVALLAAQIALGASVIWTGRNAYFTTAHVLVGAMLSAATFLLVWLAHRDEIESRSVRRETPRRENPAVNGAAVRA